MTNVPTKPVTPTDLHTDPRIPTASYLREPPTPFSTDTKPTAYFATPVIDESYRRAYEKLTIQPELMPKVEVEPKDVADKLDEILQAVKKSPSQKEKVVTALRAVLSEVEEESV